MEIRTLRPDEKEAVLALLDLWGVPDGWQGRDFFRRYLDADPRFDRNVWVAIEDGKPVSCVQIFPHRLRVREAEIALGGIGSVFTHPAFRKAGIASALLGRAWEAMRERGMALSILFTGRIEWYEKLGWRRWPFARALYVREGAPGPPPPDVAIEPFDRARDLDEVAAIHARYSATRDATAVRDAAAWETSLRVAGNPDETFRIARHRDRIVAYARSVRLDGHPVLTEFGRAPDAAEPLAALLDAGFDAGGAFGTAPADAELEAALGVRGVAIRPVADPSTMLACLDGEALRRATGLEAVAGEDDEALLRRALPPERCLYWPADRF